jgi:protocatechuate 3,4-dioxygenase beta subunit
MKLAVALVAAASLVSSASAIDQVTGREQVVGLPCDGCAIVFTSIPKTIGSVSRIAPAQELGEPMRIDGVVRDQRGKPMAGIIVYAYHTNAKGIYPGSDRSSAQSTTPHGQLRSWAKTDAMGRYHFDTIRPGGYPNTDIPQHVHMHVIEPGRCTYYIDDIVFTDDPRLTAEQRKSHMRGRGGFGVATPKKDAAGTWLVTRDIVLGQGVPGYPGLP